MRFKSLLLAVIVIAASFGGTEVVRAHAGGTDEYGCHGGSQPYHCHGGSDDSGSASGGWVDIVPKLRIPSISINLGRIIPSVSIGSPVKWGFKVPFSFAPRIRFMKLQIYFDPDFDYFVRKAGWITIAAIKATGNTANVKHQQRAGASKYRVYSPEGGGYQEWKSKSAVIRVKGRRISGNLTIEPSSIYEEQRVVLTVKLDDEKTKRIIYLLTAPSCNESKPWINDKGPAEGWSVMGFLTPPQAQQEHLVSTGRDFVSIRRTVFGSWSHTDALTKSTAEPLSGLTTEGKWSHSVQLAASDNNRCFAAIVPGSGIYHHWVSNVVRATVKAREQSNFKLDQAVLKAVSTVSSTISGTISANQPRTISAELCDSKELDPATTTSDANGKFSLTFEKTLPMGTYKVCVSAARDATYGSAKAELSLEVTREKLSGSVKISKTEINTGQQFTVSGSISPKVENKQVWIRVYCSNQVHYPTGWASQDFVQPAHSTTGNPSGDVGLDDYNYAAETYSITRITVDSSGNFSKTFTSNTPRTCVYGAYTPATDYHTAWLSDPTDAITVSRTTLSGSVSISTTAINTGQQFTVSGSISPKVENKQIWIRVYCSNQVHYPTGWASQDFVQPAHSTTGNPSGDVGLDDYNYAAETYSITRITVDSSGNFSKTFTSNTPRTCVYGAYTPATDYHTAWLSDPTDAITIS